MARLRQDLGYAWRTFTKAPGFTLTAVLVLGIGIGANTAVFTIVNEMLFRPLSGRAGELVGVYSHDRTVPDSYRAFSYANYADIRDQNDIFDGLMAHTFAMVGEPAGDQTRRVFAGVVSSNYFDTLGVSLAAGRPFSAEEERPGARIPVAIVRYARWEKEGLDPSFVGRTIRINAEDFTVVGVATKDFTGTMALVAAEVYLPLGMFDVVVNDIWARTDHPSAAHGESGPGRRRRGPRHDLQLLGHAGARGLLRTGVAGARHAERRTRCDGALHDDRLRRAQHARLIHRDRHMVHARGTMTRLYPC